MSYRSKITMMHDVAMYPDLEYLRSIALSQGGFFSVRDAREAGLSADLIQYYVRKGTIERVQRGLYRFPFIPPDTYTEEREAWMRAGRDAAISHESALKLHGLSDVLPHAVHLIVPRSRRWLRVPGAVVHTVSEVLPPDQLTIVAGICVTVPVRTIWDAAEDGTAPEQIVRAVGEALDRGLALPNDFRSPPAQGYSTRTHDLIAFARAHYP